MHAEVRCQGFSIENGAILLFPVVRYVFERGYGSATRDMCHGVGARRLSADPAKARRGRLTVKCAGRQKSMGDMLPSSPS